MHTDSMAPVTAQRGEITPNHLSKWKLIYYFIIAVSVIPAMLIGLQYWVAEHRLQTQKREEVRKVMDSLIGIIQRNVQAYDFDAAANVCGTMLLSPDVTRMSVILRLDNGAAPITICDEKTERLSSEKTRAMEFSLAGDPPSYIIDIQVDRVEADSQALFFEAAKETSIAFVFIFSLLAGFAFMFAHLFIIPQLEKIISAMRRATRQDLPVEEILDHGFLGSVTDQFRDMQRSLKLEQYERSRAENELRDSEYRLRTTLNSIGDSVIAIDNNGAIIHMNPVAERLTGVGLAVAKKMHVDDLFSNLLADSSLAWSMGSKTPTRHQIKNRDGTQRVVSEVSSPILSDDDDTLGNVIVLRDVTREEELQNSLLQSEKMRVIGQLASGIAHDFNNALGGISASAQVLGHRLNSKSEPGLKECLDVIERSSSRAATLVDKLLQFGRKTPPSSHQAIIGSVMNDTIQFLKQTVGPNFTMKLSIDELAGTEFVHGHHNELESMLLNICLNGIQAMGNEGRLTIRSFCRRPKGEDEIFILPVPEGKWVGISVEDNGVGIAPSDIQRIFEPFYSTKIEKGGTGLGMAMVYNTLQMYGGGISIRSTPGKGTRISLYLAIGGIGSSLPSKRSKPMKHSKGTILVVDDEEDFRSMLAIMLETLGYKVIQEKNAQKCLDLVTRKKPKLDFALLDMTMPVMDGAKLAKHLHQIRPELKIIIMSGALDYDRLDEIDPATLFSTLKKPITFDDLVSTLSGARQPAL